jgi:hypothetical protein
MAVSSGRGGFGRFPKMEVTREFFEIGKPFWYTPLADKNTNILVKPVECKSVVPPNVDGFSQQYCETYCALYKWCAEVGNFDEHGVNYIPCCDGFERKDDTGVYFKEIGK